jgi:hypothetical protein
MLRIQDGKAWTGFMWDGDKWQDFKMWYWTWKGPGWCCWYSDLLQAGRGQDGVVGIATCYRLEGPGIESRWGQDFSHLSRLALGPTQPPVQWVPGLSRGQRWPGHDDHPPPSSAKVMKEESYTSTSPLDLCGLLQGETLPYWTWRMPKMCWISWIVDGLCASQERIYCLELTNLIFCWPCIVIYPYNQNQLDALFTFNLFQ